MTRWAVPVGHWQGRLISDGLRRNLNLGDDPGAHFPAQDGEV